MDFRMNAAATRDPHPLGRGLSQSHLSAFAAGQDRLDQRDRPAPGAVARLGERDGQAALRAGSAGARALQGRPAHGRRPPRRAPDAAPPPADRGLPRGVPGLHLGHRARRSRAAGARGLRYPGRAHGRGAGQSDGGSPWRSDPDTRRRHRRARQHPAVGGAGRRQVEIRQVEESQPDRLRYIASVGLRPGVQITVVDRQPFQGPITIEVAGETHVIGNELGQVVRCAQ